MYMALVSKPTRVHDKTMKSNRMRGSNWTKSSPTVRWYAHLVGDLGDTDSDVLILLDCCSSGLLFFWTAVLLEGPAATPKEEPRS